MNALCCAGKLQFFSGLYCAENEVKNHQKIQKILNFQNEIKMRFKQKARY